MSRAKKRFTTHSDPAAMRAPDLLDREFTATRPNQKWVADFTYCSTWSGIVYVAFVTDVSSSPHRRLEGVPVDERYTDRLDDIGAAPSIGSVGDSFDNAKAESVIGLFKTELHRNPTVLARHGGHWRGLDDLEIAACGWVSWLNDERILRRARRGHAGRGGSGLPSAISAQRGLRTQPSEPPGNQAYSALG